VVADVVRGERSVGGEVVQDIGDLGRVRPETASD